MRPAGIILTTHDKLAHYLGMLTHQVRGRMRVFRAEGLPFFQRGMLTHQVRGI